MSDEPSQQRPVVADRLIERVVEAVAFSADEPVPAERLSALVANVTGAASPSLERIETAVERINTAAADGGRPLRIEYWGGGFRMATTDEVAPFLKAYFQDEPRSHLSRSLMETLAVVAYRQPVTKPEVDFVRGVDAGYGIRKLLELSLIDVAGRSDAIGRPLLYVTTDRFLEQFGLSYLDDLPTLREIEELLDDPQFNREKAQMLVAEGVARQADASDDTENPPPPDGDGDAVDHEAA